MYVIVQLCKNSKNYYDKNRLCLKKIFLSSDLKLYTSVLVLAYLC